MTKHLPKGQGAPSDGRDTNRDGQPIRHLTETAKTLMCIFRGVAIRNRKRNWLSNFYVPTAMN